MTEVKPLVLDVDGTFLKTDMLFETFWAGLGRDPLATLRATLRNLGRPEVLKAHEDVEARRRERQRQGV